MSYVYQTSRPVQNLGSYNTNYIVQELANDVVGHLVLIIPAGVIVAICYLVAAWLKSRSSSKDS